MKIRDFAKYSVVAIFVAILVTFPWDTIQRSPFQDRARYTDYFLHQETIFEYLQFKSITDYLSNEVLWHYVMLYLVRDLNVPIDNIFMVIAVLCIGSYSVFLVRRNGLLALPLLINPLLITFAFDQLRLALAYSLLLIAYMTGNRIVMLITAIVTSFIHTSIALIVAIYVALLFVKKTLVMRGANKMASYLFLVALGVMVSVAIGPLREIILGFLHDRRAHLADSESSFIYTLYWVGLLALFSVQSLKFFSDEAHCYAIVILSLVSCNLLTGGYTLRFLSLGLPMILSAMLNMKLNSRVLALTVFAGYAIFQWSYWVVGGGAFALQH